MNNSETETRLKDELLKLAAYRKDLEKRMALKKQIDAEKKLLRELNPSFMNKLIKKIRGDGLP